MLSVANMESLFGVPRTRVQRFRCGLRLGWMASSKVNVTARVVVDNSTYDNKVIIQSGKLLPDEMEEWTAVAKQPTDVRRCGDCKVVDLYLEPVATVMVLFLFLGGGARPSRQAGAVHLTRD